MDGKAGWVVRPPGSGLFRILANRDLSWFKVLGELIDNSFDAASTRVEIEMYPKQFAVSDDGNGCRDILLIVQPAQRDSHETTKLGRYGIGAKDALAWIASEDGVISIASTYRGNRYSTIVDLRDYALSGWQLREPGVEGTANIRGTRIEVRNPVHRAPDGERLQELKDRISFFYSPAMQAGKQILIRTGASKKPITLTAFQYPEFDEVIDEILDVNGKKAHIRIGITKEGAQNPYPGIAYQHEWRVIKRSLNGEGCEGVSSARIFGTVQVMGNEWGLTTNKDNLRDADALYDAVQHRCAGLYAKVKTLHERIELDGLTQAVEAELGAMLPRIAAEPNKKAKREKTEELEGTVTPKETDQKHKKAARKQPGKTFSDTGCGGVTVSWNFLGPGKLGECLRNGDNLEVILNLDLPRILAARDSANIEVIAVFAALLVSDYVVNRLPITERKGFLLFEPAGYILENMARLLSGPCAGSKLHLFKKATA